MWLSSCIYVKNLPGQSQRSTRPVASPPWATKAASYDNSCLCTVPPSDELHQRGPTQTSAREWSCPYLGYLSPCQPSPTRAPGALGKMFLLTLQEDLVGAHLHVNGAFAMLFLLLFHLFFCSPWQAAQWVFKLTGENTFCENENDHN